jgi:hypothetical protein
MKRRDMGVTCTNKMYTPSLHYNQQNFDMVRYNLKKLKMRRLTKALIGSQF